MVSLQLPLFPLGQNTASSWFPGCELEDMDGTATVIARHERLDVRAVTQLERDAVLVAYDNIVQVRSEVRDGQVRRQRADW